jgi:hypothetical protein
LCVFWAWPIAAEIAVHSLLGAAAGAALGAHGHACEDPLVSAGAVLEMLVVAADLAVALSCPAELLAAAAGPAAAMAATAVATAPTVVVLQTAMPLLRHGLELGVRIVMFPSCRGRKRPPCRTLTASGIIANG